MSEHDPLEALRAELSELDPDLLAALTTPLNTRAKNRIASRLKSGQRARRRTRRAIGMTAALALCVSLGWVISLDRGREEQLRFASNSHPKHDVSQASEAARLTREAEALRNQQHYDEAVELLERALAIREHALGPDHLEVAANLTELAELYRTQELPAKAEPLYRRAYAIQPTSVF